MPTKKSNPTEWTRFLELMDTPDLTDLEQQEYDRLSKLFNPDAPTKATQTCTRCKQTKGIEEFNRYKNRTKSVKKYCKSCESKEKESKIKPNHYKNNAGKDLFDRWYNEYPFNEFKTGMQMIAERYMKRNKDNRIEDLEKAREVLRRLSEYEEMER